MCRVSQHGSKSCSAVWERNQRCLTILYGWSLALCEVVCVQVVINSFYQYLQSSRLSTRYDSSIEVTMLSKPEKIYAFVWFTFCISQCCYDKTLSEINLTEKEVCLGSGLGPAACCLWWHNALCWVCMVEVACSPHGSHQSMRAKEKRPLPQCSFQNHNHNDLTSSKENPSANNNNPSSPTSIKGFGSNLFFIDFWGGSRAVFQQPGSPTFCWIIGSQTDRDWTYFKCCACTVILWEFVKINQ